MTVADVALVQSGGQGVTAEVRVPARAGETPDISEHFNSLGFQQEDKFIQRSGGMSYGPDFSHCLDTISLVRPNSQMKGKAPLPRSFYQPSAGVVARALLGHWLIHESVNGMCGGPIVETETYVTN